MIFTIPVSILFTRHMSRITRPLYAERSRSYGIMNGYAEEMLSGQKTIKAYNREIYTIDRFEEQNEIAVDAYYKADYMAVFNGPSVMMISNI